MVRHPTTHLRPFDFALAFSLVTATVFLLISILSMVDVFGELSTIIKIFSELYGSIGYGPTPLGAALGTIYIFIDTFILTWIFVWLYNKLSK